MLNLNEHNQGKNQKYDVVVNEVNKWITQGLSGFPQWIFVSLSDALHKEGLTPLNLTMDGLGEAIPYGKNRFKSRTKIMHELFNLKTYPEYNQPSLPLMPPQAPVVAPQAPLASSSTNHTSEDENPMTRLKNALAARIDIDIPVVKTNDENFDDFISAIDDVLTQSVKQVDILNDAIVKLVSLRVKVEGLKVVK